MIGRLEVRKYDVKVSPPSAENRKKLLQRLDVMNRELAHAQMAVSQLRNALQHPGSTKSLADGLLSSRNWVLSLLISHAFIQMILDNDSPYFSTHTIQTRMMAAEAVQEGMEQARQEHIKDIHRTS
jgi:hypothetical protein